MLFRFTKRCLASSESDKKEAERGGGLGLLGFRVEGLGFRLWGLGFRLWGLGFRIWGLGFRI